MEKKMWLVRAATLALVGSLTWEATAQKPPPKGAPPAPAPAAPAAPETKAEDTEGPFAPKGRTGKMKETTSQEEAAPKEKPAGPPPPEKPGAAGLDMVFGWGNNGHGTEAFDMSVVSFILSGSYQLTPVWGVRLRVPFATGKITEPPAAGYNAAAFGNVELAGSYRLELSERVRLPIELALTPPTASGVRFSQPDEMGSRRSYRVNTAAQVTRGLEEDALFAPHRFGIVPKATIQYLGDSFTAAAYTKVPMLIRAGGEDPRPPPPGMPDYNIRSAVIQWLVGGEIHFGLLENKLDLGTRAWTALLSNEYIDVLATALVPPTKFQFVLEPQVRAFFGPVRAGIGFIWPIGGRLGSDNQQVNGLRLFGSYAF